MSHESEAIHKFTDKEVPVREFDNFYRLEENAIPSEMPYCWVMFVQSIDGKISFLNYAHPIPSIGLSGPGIALADIKDRMTVATGADVDYGALQYLWAIAGATIAGSGILDAEPTLTWMPINPELLALFHQIHDGKEPPFRIIVTGKGLTAEQLNQCQVFHHDGKLFRTMVATTDNGLNNMTRVMKDLKEKPNAIFTSFGEKSVDFKKLLGTLRTQYGVETVDCQGGPKVAGQFLEAGLVHELRLTISPVIAGSKNPQGLLLPSTFEASFDQSQAPLVKILGVGRYGEHLFLRDRIIYR